MVLIIKSKKITILIILHIWNRKNFFFGKRSSILNEEIIKFNNFYKKFKTDLNNLSEIEIKTYYEKINDKLTEIWLDRSNLINSLINKFLYDKIDYESVIVLFDEQINDNRFISKNWYDIMNITNERTKAEARYSKSFNEVQIGNIVSKIENKWLKNDIPHKDYLKLCDFFKTFGYLDIIYKYKHELAIFPFLYEKNFGIKYGDFMETFDTSEEKDKYNNDKIIYLYRTFKEISIIEDYMNWYTISPGTYNSFWFNWINSVKHIFNESYKKLNIKLEGEFQIYKPGDWDVNNLRRRFDESKIINYIPEAINRNDQNSVDNYIEHFISKIKYNNFLVFSKEIQWKMLKDVYYKICYAVEFNYYKSNYFVQKYIYEKNKTKFVNVVNNSFFNRGMKIKDIDEILSITKDRHKIEGLVFMNEDFLNSPSIITENDVISNLHNIENDYREKEKISNMEKIYLLNKFLRKFDLFNEIYFELSIFPYLFENILGFKYAEWIQDVNANKDPKFGFLYKDYMLEQYILFRDWKIFYEKYNYKANTTLVKYFDKLTLESNWYKWFSSIDFQKHYFSFSGILHNN